MIVGPMTSDRLRDIHLSRKMTVVRARFSSAIEKFPAPADRDAAAPLRDRLFWIGAPATTIIIATHGHLNPTSKNATQYAMPSVRYSGRSIMTPFPFLFGGEAARSSARVLPWLCRATWASVRM